MTCTQHIAKRRKALADKIVCRAWDWQVCESCETVVRGDQPVCPVCHAYRFNADALAVIDAAFKLGSRPVAETFAYTPRTNSPVV